MEEKEYSAAEAKAFILGKFIEQGDFPAIMSQDQLGKMIDEVLALDEAFMAKAGIGDGQVYDDDAAFDYLFAEMEKKHDDDLKMYMMRLVEDYMDYNEQYLDSIGAIDWE